MTLVDRVKKNLGKKQLSISSLGDPDIGANVKHFIPTSSMVLNKAMGGGFPCGRMSEIYGVYSSGKSSLVADVLANTQRLGGSAVIIDAEHAFKPERARDMGVDVESVIYSDEAIVERIFDVIDALLEELDPKGPPSCIIWDSVASSPTQTEIDADVSTKTVAEKPRLLSKGIRRITGKIPNNLAFILVNQVRTNINIKFGDPQDSVGGNALWFWASVRLKLKKTTTLKDKNNKPIGIVCSAYTKKNKICPPFKTVEFEMPFTGGIDDSNYILDLLINADAIEQKGSWYSYNSKKFMRKDFNKFLEGLKESERNKLINKGLELI